MIHMTDKSYMYELDPKQILTKYPWTSPEAEFAFVHVLTSNFPNISKMRKLKKLNYTSTYPKNDWEFPVEVAKRAEPTEPARPEPGF